MNQGPLFDDDPGIMSEVETASTGFRRGGKQRSSLPVVRTPSKTLERPLGNNSKISFPSLFYRIILILIFSFFSQKTVILKVWYFCNIDLKLRGRYYQMK